MHIVEPLESGDRFAIPAFFVTRAAESAGAAETRDASASAAHAGEAEDDAAIAEALWRGLLMPNSEDDFRAFLGRWHELLAVSRHPARDELLAKTVPYFGPS